MLELIAPRPSNLCIEIGSRPITAKIAARVLDDMRLQHETVNEDFRERKAGGDDADAGMETGNKGEVEGVSGDVGGTQGRVDIYEPK